MSLKVNQMIQKKNRAKYPVHPRGIEARTSVYCHLVDEFQWEWCSDSNNEVPD